MEQDPEVSGDGNSYTTEFRSYDPRLGRWKSLDPLMAKFAHSSPYVAFADNPIFFVDADGNEPTVANRIGLSAYIALVRTVRCMNCDFLSKMHKFYGGQSNTIVTHRSARSVGDSDVGRYLYSDRWGWIDMKHFFSAANLTDYLVFSGDFALEYGEDVERKQEKAGVPSGYDYEDLKSNLLGVYFEKYLEDFNSTRMSDEEEADLKDNYGGNWGAYALKKFLTEIGVVEDITVAPNYYDKNFPADHDAPSTWQTNKTYDPVHTDPDKNPRDHEIDLLILKRLQEFQDSQEK
jgi:RHS repeat-associated protein